HIAFLGFPRAVEISNYDKAGRDTDTYLERLLDAQFAGPLRQAPAQLAPRARHHPHARADSRNTPAPRRPCIWPRTRRTGRPSPRRTRDTRRLWNADLRDRALQKAPSSRRGR